MAKTANNEQGFSKVFKAALECKYHGMSVDNLLRVIYATPNPEVAMELMLGIHEEPVINQVVVDSNNRKLTFISFNTFGREVNYSYEQNKSVHIYVSKDVNVAEITSENYQEYKKSWGDNTTGHNVIFPEMEELQSTMTLSAWEKCQKWHAPQVKEPDYYLED
jgi:hypothetical protein